jgi:hypothetical protein
MNAEHAQNEHDDHDQPDEINDAIHGIAPSIHWMKGRLE